MNLVLSLFVRDRNPVKELFKSRDSVIREDFESESNVKTSLGEEGK